MIAVFSCDPGLQDSIQAALAGLSVIFETDCERFPQSVATAQVGVVVVPRLDDDATNAWFRKLAQSHPGKLWVLVTGAEKENIAKLIHWGGISEVVWKSEVPEELRPRVRKLLRTDPIARFADFLQDSTKTSEEVVQFLRGACLSRPLPTTVSGLCRKVGIKEPRIRYLWPRSFQPGHSPKEFVDTLVLVRSLDLHDSLGSWEKVAAAVHIREETLREICHRLTGLGLSAAHRRAREEGMDLLQEWWLRSRVS